MNVKLFFAWYDFWVGFYWDRDKRALYVAPLPCVVFKVERKKREAVKICVECGQYVADWPSKICVGCAAYREHAAPQ